MFTGHADYIVTGKQCKKAYSNRFGQRVIRSIEQVSGVGLQSSDQRVKRVDRRFFAANLDMAYQCLVFAQKHTQLVLAVTVLLAQYSYSIWAKHIDPVSFPLDFISIRNIITRFYAMSITNGNNQA